MLLICAVSIVAAAVGLTLAAIAYRFARIPGWRDQRWFWLLTGSAALYSACNSVITLDVSDGVIRVTSQAVMIFISLHVAAWNLHAAAHLGEPLGAARKALVVAVLAAGLIAQLPGLAFESTVMHHDVRWLHARYAEPALTPTGQALAALFVVALIVPFVRYARAARRERDARVYVAAMAALLVAGINDTFAGTGRYPIPYLLDVGFLCALSLMGFVHVRRFAESAHKLEALSTQLEAVVEDRTRELGQAQDALARSERLAAIGRLAAGVAHEINNPAAAVVANLSYLKESIEQDAGLPSDAGEALGDAVHSMERIKRIVRQLLDSGRVAVGAGATAASVRLARVAERAVRTARASYGERVTIALLIPDDVVVLAEGLSLEQVITNLIVNAIQAIPPDRDDGRIELRAARLGNGRVRLAVTDNGTGVSPDVAQRMFNPFFTTKPFGTGNGLGLSVSLGLIRAVRGDVRLERSDATGTTMTVELPAAVEHKSLPPPAPREAPGPRRRVLIVDDERAVRDGLARMLSSTCEVDVAASPGEGLERVRASGPYDAILCDVMMDEGGGPAFCAKLATEAPQIDRRVILMTGGAADDESRRFVERAAYPVVQKPIDRQALELLVKQVSQVRPDLAS